MPAFLIPIGEIGAGWRPAGDPWLCRHCRLPLLATIRAILATFVDGEARAGSPLTRPSGLKSAQILTLPKRDPLETLFGLRSI